MLVAIAVINDKLFETVMVNMVSYLLQLETFIIGRPTLKLWKGIVFTQQHFVL